MSKHSRRPQRHSQPQPQPLEFHISTNSYTASAIATATATATDSGPSLCCRFIKNVNVLVLIVVVVLGFALCGALIQLSGIEMTQITHRNWAWMKRVIPSQPPQDMQRNANVDPPPDINVDPIINVSATLCGTDYSVGSTPITNDSGSGFASGSGFGAGCFSSACACWSASNPAASRAVSGSAACLAYRYGTTLVVGFYPTPHSKHSLDEYREWMSRLFSFVLCPMVVYTTPEWVPFIQQLRNKTVERQTRHEAPPTQDEITYFLQRTQRWDPPHAQRIQAYKRHQVPSSSKNGSVSTAVNISVNAPHDYMYDPLLSTYYITAWSVPWDLPPVRSVSTAEWERVHAQDRDPVAGKHNRHLYAVWTAKPWMVAHAAIINPFRSKFFFWTDAGALRWVGQRFPSFGDTDILDDIYRLNPNTTRQQWEREEYKQQMRHLQHHQYQQRQQQQQQTSSLASLCSNSSLPTPLRLSSWLSSPHSYLSGEWCLPGANSSEALEVGVGTAKGVRDPFMCFPYRYSVHPSVQPVQSRKDKMLFASVCYWGTFLNRAGVPCYDVNATTPFPFPSSGWRPMWAPIVTGDVFEGGVFGGTRAATHWFAHAYYRYISLFAAPYGASVWGHEQPTMQSLALHAPSSFLVFEAHRFCLHGTKWQLFWMRFSRKEHRSVNLVPDCQPLFTHTWPEENSTDTRPSSIIELEQACHRPDPYAG